MATNIISQRDYGYTFTISLIDNKNNPVQSQDTKINAYIIYPDNTEHKVKDSHLTVIDAINGLLRIELTKEDTEQTGNYSIYVELEGINYTLNTNTAINYYVNARHGIE